jgi:hypothetical protein
MPHDFWAITAFFNPMGWQSRLANYRTFREHLSIPLVAVELGYNGQFQLTPADADILIQIPGHDVMWQKERLLNIALDAVPPEIERIACLDSDVVFDRADVWLAADHTLDHCPIAQLFSHVEYLPLHDSRDRNRIRQTITPAPGFSWLRELGYSPLELCKPTWANSDDYPPVTYGLGWAFRRGLFADLGLYDPWIVGGGTRVHFYAAHGLLKEAADAFQFRPAMSDHFNDWAEDFHAAVDGNWGYVPGSVMHLWHGTPARRKHRQRYTEFAQFDFDPTLDLTIDDDGAWRWNRDNRPMHRYLREYIAGRREDDLTEESPLFQVERAAA